MFKNRVAAVLAIATITAAATAAMPEHASAQEQAASAASADSIYRAARRALSEGENERAAALFSDIVEIHPDSEYAPDALYWRAFSLYRVGGEDEMRVALAALERQRESYPDAATRGDAQTLAVRITGELAQFGLTEAAAQIRQRVQRVSEMAEEARALARSRALDPSEVRARVQEAQERIQEAQERMAEARAEMAGRVHAHSNCPEADLRAAALNALMRMDEEEAIPVAREVLADRDACSEDLREHALFMLVRTDAPEIQELLLEVAVNDPSEDVQEAAVYAIARMDGTGATDVLIQLFRQSDEEDLREAVLHAITRSDDSRAPDFLREVIADSTVSEDIRESAIFLVARGEADVRVDWLRSLYGQLNHTDLQEAILHVIARQGGDSNHQWLMQRVLDPNESMDLRESALYAAMRMEDMPVSNLTSLYDREINREMKETLIHIFARSDEDAAMDKLIRIARSEQDPELRETAVFALARSDDPRAIEVLKEIINQNDRSE